MYLHDTALCDTARHHNGTPATQRQQPLPTVPPAILLGKAWATPGLLSPVLCSAGAALLPGGGEERVRWTRHLGKWPGGGGRAGEENRGFVAGPAPQPLWVPAAVHGGKMKKYLLFNPLDPENLPTLKELTTSGKALKSSCRSAVGATIKWRRAAETLRLGLQRGSSGTDWWLQGEPCLLVPCRSGVALPGQASCCCP